MAYQALDLPAQPSEIKTDNFDKLGENGIQPAEFQNNTALLIENVIIETETSISFRAGQTKKITQGTTAVVGGINFKGNKYFAQDDKLYVNDGTLAGNTLIHTYAGIGQARFVTFGDYLFTVNGTEKPVRISRTLAYTNGTGNFTVGQRVTQTPSGATATILEKTGTTSDGTLTFGNIKGTFVDTQAITDPITGAADADGVVGWTDTEITDAKIASKLFIHDERLVIGNFEDDTSGYRYSEKYNSLSATPNPPFTNFTTIATPPLPTDPGGASFGNAGALTEFVKLPVGNQLIALYEDGESGVVLDTINVDTVGLRQSVRIDFQGEGLGADNAVASRDLLIIVNEGGVWASQIEVNTAYPFSLTATKISRFFSDELSDELSFIGSSMVFDEKNNRVIIACKKGASFNNFVLVFYLGLRTVDGKGRIVIPYSRITGWYINTFFKVGRDIWGTSAIDGRVFELFDGTNDDGNVIPVKYHQEITEGDVNTLKEMTKIGIKGEFTEGQEIVVSFDIYDQLHMFKPDINTETFNIESSLNKAASGIGNVGISQGAIGGPIKANKLLGEQWYNRLFGIYEYTRAILKIEVAAAKKGKITYVNMTTHNKGINQNQR